MRSTHRSSLRSRLLHRHLGPTRTHLLHEIYLLTALVLLTTSSVKSLYRYSFGLAGDYVYIALTTIWLSRHLVLRVLATNDTSATANPSLSGLVSNLVSRYLVAGQYFDYPPPGTSAETSSGNGPLENAAGPWGWLFGLLPWLQQPLHGPSHHRQQSFQSARERGGAGSRKRGKSSSSIADLSEGGSADVTTGANASALASAAAQTSSRYLRSALPYRQFVKFRDTHAPPAQLAVSVLVATLLLTSLTCFHTSVCPVGGGPSPHGPQALHGVGGGANNRGLSPHGPRPGEPGIPVNNANNPHDIFATLQQQNQRSVAEAATAWASHAGRRGSNLGRFGGSGSRIWDSFDAAYDGGWRMWLRVWFYLVCGGTLASLVMYGRVLLPVPDLVAGTNVLKAVRAEAKLYGSGGGKSSKAKQKDENIPWAEQFKSIIAENRFRLVCKVAFVRIIENVFLCAVLPQTSFTCRATGHCPPGPAIWELAPILYPGGAAGGGGRGGTPTSVFDSLLFDRGTAAAAAFSAAMITAFILLAQSALLDGPYLAIMGYVSGDWVPPADGPVSPASGTVAAWDPRRKYKKGDLILGPRTGSVYRAESNNPEGRPFDPYMCASRDIFRDELGHPGTSGVAVTVAGLHIALVLLPVMTLMLVYRALGYDSSGMLWVFAANLVASYGLSHVGLMDFGELSTIAEEVSRPVRSQSQRAKRCQ